MSSDQATADRAATRNRVDGEMSGVQTDTVYGNVEIHNEAALPLRELKVRRATPAELDQVREHFSPPGGFDAAARWLTDGPAIVVCGPGTGRHYAALRLLVERSISTVVDLNRDRALDSLRSHDLTAGEGYVWDLSGLGVVAFTDWEWRHATTLVREAGCRLVVIVDEPRQVPTELAQVVRLTPPDAIEIAAASLRVRGGAMEDAIRVVKNDLADLLGGGTQPAKAVWAATMAMDVRARRIDIEQARANLAEGVEHAVSQTYLGLSTLDYGMLMAVAVLENQPYDEVAELAANLDSRIRTAQLPTDKQLRPPRVFAASKDELLATIGAEVVVRDHPEHTGLREETVRFIRQGWADAVLRQMWRQYHFLQPIALDWMGQPRMVRRFGGECALALSRLVTAVPAHAPLDITDRLAKANSVAKRFLAADALALIAGLPGLEHLVEKKLEDWIDSGTARQRSTAAHLYGTRYSRGKVTHALGQLNRIARTGSYQGVPAAVIQLLTRAEDRDQVLSRVLAWCRTHDNRGGAEYVRSAGVQVSVRVYGLQIGNEDSPVDPVELAAARPDLVRKIALEMFRDRQTGQETISTLHQICYEIDRDLTISGRGARAKREALLRMIRILAPDLRWWPRRAAVSALIRMHPTRVRSIRYIFRTAARLDRRGARRPAATTTPKFVDVRSGTATGTPR